jgi:hypothetical protein
VALFISSTLASGDLPSADQTQSTLSVRERHENAPLRGMADEDLTGLRRRMVGIGVDTCQRILERCSRLLERHAMLREVGGDLDEILLEGRGFHWRTLVYQPRLSSRLLGRSNTG